MTSMIIIVRTIQLRSVFQFFRTNKSMQPNMQILLYYLNFVGQRRHRRRCDDTRATDRLPMDLDNASDCASVGGEQAAGILLRFKIGRKRARTLKAIRSLRSLRCLKSSKSSKYSHSVSVSTCVTLFTKKSKPWHGIRSGCTNNRTETNRITSGRSEQWQTSLFLTHLFRQAPLLSRCKGKRCSR